MIGYLEGKVMSSDGNNVLLYNNGVGFEVSCSGSAYAMLVTNGEGGIYTYLQVKEDGWVLYGFSSLEEKGLFQKLITVSGVGPKMGITILSQMDAPDVAEAIASGDVKRLSLVKGLGKKTAERIVLELQEGMTATEIMPKKKNEKTKVDSDALLALTQLGFTRQECQTALEEAQSHGCTTIEQILAYAIKHIR